MSPPDRVRPLERGWLWWSLQLIVQNVFVLALRYRIHGRSKLPPGGALLLINHQSSLDPLVVAVSLARPVSFLARHNLFEIPLLGWLLRKTYVMPIHRESAGSESIRKAVERLNQGYYVGIFPEGTRSSDGTLGKIKPGFLAIIRRTEVPVVPIGLAGAAQAYPRGAWILRPHPVRVVVGEPLTVEQCRQLAAKGREDEFLSEVQLRLAECAHLASLAVRAELFGLEPPLAADRPAKSAR